MRIGLIDVDGHNFPNIPLMKLSAWHKQKGDEVEWYDPWTAWMDEYDIVYHSKVFSSSPEYPHPINAKKIVGGAVGMPYISPMGKSGTTSRRTQIFRKKSSISIRTILCIQN